MNSFNSSVISFLLGFKSCPLYILLRPLKLSLTHAVVSISIAPSENCVKNSVGLFCKGWAGGLEDSLCLYVNSPGKSFVLTSTK
jgi:hypothetical protein